MEIDCGALEISLIFTATVTILIWILEDFWMKRQERKLAGECNMDIHVSKSENLHVDMPSSQVTSDIRETVPESFSAKEDLVNHEQVMQPVSTMIRRETEQLNPKCPECQSSRIVKRGFADKAHRKQCYLYRECRVTFLKQAVVDADSND